MTLCQVKLTCDGLCPIESIVMIKHWSSCKMREEVAAICPSGSANNLHFDSICLVGCMNVSFVFLSTDSKQVPHLKLSLKIDVPLTKTLL
jgi:hypothetical protein